MFQPRNAIEGYLCGLQPLGTIMAVTLSPLHRADGSATYTKNGYSVIAAINGPVEVQRKDEIPEEAAIDVVLRPANGIGGRARYVMKSVSLQVLIEATRCEGKAPRVCCRESATSGHTCHSASADVDTSYTASRWIISGACRFNQPSSVCLGNQCGPAR